MFGNAKHESDVSAGGSIFTTNRSKKASIKLELEQDSMVDEVDEELESSRRSDSAQDFLELTEFINIKDESDHGKKSKSPPKKQRQKENPPAKNSTANRATRNRKPRKSKSIVKRCKMCIVSIAEDFHTMLDGIVIYLCKSCHENLYNTSSTANWVCRFCAQLHSKVSDVKIDCDLSDVVSTIKYSTDQIIELKGVEPSEAVSMNRPANRKLQPWSVKTPDVDEISGSESSAIPNPYVCIDCRMRFATLPILREHQRVKHIRAPTKGLTISKGHKFHCRTCQTDFAKEEYYTEHLKVIRPGGTQCRPQIFKCNGCFKNFDQPKEFENHDCRNGLQVGVDTKFARNNFVRSKYKCPTCHRGFALEIHYLEHRKTFMENGVMKCQQPLFVDETLVKRNKLSPRIPKFKCPGCSREFVHVQLYQAHIKAYKENGGSCRLPIVVVENKVEEVVPEKPQLFWFQCKACGREFRHEDHFMAHVKAFQERGMKCEPPPKSTSRRPPCLIVKSFIEVEENSLTECYICDRQLNTSTNLICHLQNEHRKLFQCAGCKKVFCSPGLQEVHEELCSDKGSKTSPIIVKTYRWKDIVLRSDSKEGDLAGFEKDATTCLVCNSEFKSFSEMRSHVREKHLVAQCPECQRLFIDADKFSRHSQKCKGQNRENESEETDSTDDEVTDAKPTISEEENAESGKKKATLQTNDEILIDLTDETMGGDDAIGQSTESLVDKETEQMMVDTETTQMKEHVQDKGTEPLKDKQTEPMKENMLDKGTEPMEERIKDKGTESIEERTLDKGTESTKESMLDKGTESMEESMLDKGTESTKESMLDKGTESMEESMLDKDQAAESAEEIGKGMVLEEEDNRMCESISCEVNKNSEANEDETEILNPKDDKRNTEEEYGRAAKFAKTDL